MLLSERCKGQELSSWQQNRMGDSIKHKVCTGLGEQHFLLGFIVDISYCVYFLSSALGGGVLFSNEN
ncbi:hypothetical protein ACJIZ3_022648 [Penstemon smallii]|uniref:Uncharacterized protein n=1 Tax=Penstemon smallii TaxID=265156 RepID=A0ABD3TNW4_9LAMI